MPPTATQPKLLCEGAYYRNRRGEKIGPMYKNTFSQEPVWKVQGERFGLLYYSDGRTSQAGESDCDLIEFWPTAKPAEAEQPGVEMPTMENTVPILKGDRFCRGDLYPDGSGYLLTIPENLIGELVWIEWFRRRTAPASVESVPVLEQNLGARLRDFRQANRLGLREFAELLGLRPSDYAEFEQGDIERIPGWIAPPSVDLREHEVDQLRKANAELLEQNQELRDGLANHIAKLTYAEAQLAASKGEAGQYAWRDARPEDVGSKWEARGRDKDHDEWRYGERRIIGYVPTDAFPWKTSVAGCAAFSWRYCQVYAPVEAQAEPQDDWRELTKGDTYSGPGQVRDGYGAAWKDANISATDNGGGFPFVAKVDGSFYSTFKQARVKGGSRD